MLISTESIVWRWKDYFKDLINPTNTHSKEEAEAVLSSLGSMGLSNSAATAPQGFMRIVPSS